MDCSKDEGGGGGGIQKGLLQEISNAMNGQLHFSNTFPGVQFINFGFFTTFLSVYTNRIITTKCQFKASPN